MRPTPHTSTTGCILLIISADSCKSDKKHPMHGGFYLWRMGRDSNPRKSCPFSGFQDRRIRPLCHPSETVSFYPPVFQTCGFVCGTSFGNCARIFYIYFLRIATVKIVAPATNIIADNNCPIVSPQLVKKPIWTSGARNCSQNMRATAYPIPNIPPKAPA